MEKKKIIVIFVSLAVLFVASYVVENETQHALVEGKGGSASARVRQISAYFFYGDGCPHCGRVKPFIADVERQLSIVINKYEIYRDRNNVALLNQFFDRHEVPRERRGVPALFVLDSYLIGDEPILNEFEEIVSEALEMESTVNSTPIPVSMSPENSVDEVGCSQSTAQSECLAITTVTVAALVDSMSPCSLAVLLFLIGVRPLVPDRRMRALKVGLAFVLSVFVTYTLFGLGLLNMIQVSGLSSTFGWVAGLIAIIAGILYVKDSLWHGAGGFVMEIPRSLRPFTGKLVKSVTSPVGAFLIGFAICCFELPCTGGPYLFILGQLANTATKLMAIPLLLYYNFLFILPLLLLTLLLYFGFFTIKRAREWNDGSKGPLRMGSGLAIIALGIIVVSSSDIVGLSHIFLSVGKAVFPPVLFTFSCYLALSFLHSNQTLARRLAKTITLATLMVLSIFAFPQMFRVVQNAAEPNTELVTNELLSGSALSQESTQCDSGNVGCGKANGLATLSRDWVLQPEKTRELTAEELAEIEERAKLYDDESFDEVTEQKTEYPSTCDGKSPGMANPAAVYCAGLGYEYKIVEAEEGQDGICIFPDNSECGEWEFLTGKCGQEYSYCARQGYDLITKDDGKNSLSKEYAVCVYEGNEIGAVGDLFGLSEKSTMGIDRADDSMNKSDNTSLIEPQGPYPTFDWRNRDSKNWITPVKNQGGCGSCWAFSAVGVTEALYNIRTNNPDVDLDLSEQFLVSDCTTVGTCCGGVLSQALEYIRDHGTTSEACFPYADFFCSCNGGCNATRCSFNTGGQCSNAACADRCADWQKRLTSLSSYTQVDPYEDLMESAIYFHGPLAVAMGFGGDFGGYWDNDIYRCTDDTGVNHGVVIVGYNDTGDYWIVKNSHGIGFGDNGFFKVGYGECAIESIVYYADPDGATCGETITSDTVYVNLFACPGNGLIIGASDITLDCSGSAGGGLGAGIGIYNTYNNVTIKNCKIHDFDYGIYMEYIADYNHLLNNYVYNNRVYGIYLRNAWFNEIGVHASEFIPFNQVWGNGQSGLYLYNSFYNNISDSYFYDNGESGLYLYNSWDNNISDSHFSRNGWNGIELRGDSQYNDILNNDSSENGMNGIMMDTDTNLLKGNTASSNSKHGFSLNSTSDNTLQNNWIEENDLDGIYVYNSTSTRVIDNRLYANGFAGIFLSTDSNYSTIHLNDITGNYWYGIYMIDAHHNDVYDNKLWDNGVSSSEIYLGLSNDNNFSNNVITHGSSRGISIETSYNTVFYNNTVCGSIPGIWDFYKASAGSYTANENVCDSTYGFRDGGQGFGCDWECSGCRKVENDLVISKSVQLCPYTYNVEDLGSFGVITIGSDNIVLDCQGAEIVGVSTSTGWGIINPGYDYVTVRNCKIHNYWLGIAFETGSSYGSIVNNDASANSGGIRLLESNYGTISGNTANFNTQIGLVLTRNSDYNTLIYNIAKGNSMQGIAIYSGCDNNYVTFNRVIGNSDGIWIYNSGNNHMHGNIVEDNINTGVYFSPSSANNNELDHNRVCRNALDIKDEDLNFGDNNFCTTTGNWDDTGTIGCTFSCFLGDIDVDGVVNVFDLYLLSKAYDTAATHPSYHSGADVDVDDDVDEDDLRTVSGNYGKTF